MNNEDKILELLSKLNESQITSNEQLTSIESTFEKRMDALGHDLTDEIKDIANALTELFASINGLYAYVKKEHEATRAHINMLVGGQNLIVQQLDSAQNRLFELEKEHVKQ